jgi:hypothetical protein
MKAARSIMRSERPINGGGDVSGMRQLAGKHNGDFTFTLYRKYKE